ncbi:hypothetical protein KKB99_00175 [bacterium]|nr:hypothetical protein [bacterium]MBU1024400.1 hypothetical protein [bacterium]
MRYFSTLVVVSLLLVFLGCSSQSSDPVVTPTIKSDDITNPFERESSTEQAVELSYWSDIIYFEGEYWLAHRNDDGTLHRALGKGIRTSLSDTGIIDSHPELFNISSADLLKVEEYTNDSIRYVFFRQVVGGIQVKDSRVELRYARNGNLAMIGADVFPDLVINPVPSVNASGAQLTASSDSGFDARSAELVIEKRQYDKFHLVWRVLSGDFKYHIDAHDGSILERESTVLDDHSWTTEVESYELSPSTPLMTVPYPDQLNEVDIPDVGITDYYANDDGDVVVDSEEATLNVDSFMHSQWVNLIPCDGVYAQGKINWTSLVNDPQTILFDDSNSHMGERMVGYWANFAHNYIKNYDPLFEGMDFPLDSNADCCCACNAFAHIEAPFWIKMYQPSGSCVATSEIADVIVHEYGHIYVATQYTLGNPPLSIHEGFADFLANTVTDQPEIGKDITGAGTNFRSSDNKVLFDKNNCGGESHCVGNIIAGALWEIRLAIGAEYTDHLWHQARYAQSGSFPDYVADFYFVDDDDDNVLNGTPNMVVFEDSFWTNHHIPIPSMPDIPTDGVTLDIFPTDFPIEMDSAIGNNLFYKAKIKNLNAEATTFEIWTAVEPAWGGWYGPMIPASINIVSPINWTLGPSEEVVFNVRHSIPAALPTGVYRYHARIGEFVDHTNDILLDDGWIDFTIY